MGDCDHFIRWHTCSLHLKNSIEEKVQYICLPVPILNRIANDSRLSSCLLVFIESSTRDSSNKPEEVVNSKIVQNIAFHKKKRVVSWHTRTDELNLSARRGYRACAERVSREVESGSTVKNVALGRNCVGFDPEHEF
ncbi:hypothetical protein EVAR_50667_1 [Eumeta japonica]|uniref:Uncharacterized protein n=1 Tax=Eumeta variegata TaxID=151549 RepID=A0A4C1XPK9_EUMVA|nr:hypothetical protein EVAR_50667_1 [Eumeta japonica]